MTIHDLPPEVINYMMSEFGDVESIMQMRSTSQDFLKTLSSNVDLKKLDALNKNHKLGLKDKIAYQILKLTSQVATAESFEDIKLAASLNPKITPKDIRPEDLAKIEANYQKIQSGYNELLQSLSAFSPAATVNDIYEVVKEMGPVILLGILSSGIASVSGMELPMSAAWMSATLPYLKWGIPLAVGGFAAINLPDQISQFRAMTTNIMTSLMSEIKSTQ